MNCRKADKWLAKRILGILGAKQAEALADHLKECESCQEEARRYEQAYAALQAKLTTGPSPYLAEQVICLAKKKQLSPLSTQPRSWWLPALASAAVLGLVFFTVPRFFIPTVSMSAEEVLDAYSEDLNLLGFWEEEENGFSDDFDYENYGIPPEISQYMI